MERKRENTIAYLSMHIRQHTVNGLGFVINNIEREPKYNTVNGLGFVINKIEQEPKCNTADALKAVTKELMHSSTDTYSNSFILHACLSF